MTTFYGKTFASSFSDLNLVGNAHQGTLSSYYTEISYGYACSDRNRHKAKSNFLSDSGIVDQSCRILHLRGDNVRQKALILHHKQQDNRNHLITNYNENKIFIKSYCAVYGNDGLLCTLQCLQQR